MKKKKQLTTVLLGLLSCTAMAQDIKVLYLSTVTTTGEVIVSRLAEGEEMPLVNVADKTMKINSAVFPITQISAIRYEIRTESADAIRTLEAESGDGTSADTAVYTIDGRLMSRKASERLPKGIYIMNNKKVVVR
jgi:hypothetical protein